MSQTYNALLVNKIIADFQKGEKHPSFDKAFHYHTHLWEFHLFLLPMHHEPGKGEEV